jgi:hypothetical protein
MVIVNAPWTLAVAWKIIRGWLDARTQQKIQIVRGRDQYLPILRGLMDDDAIPDAYGGTGGPVKLDLTGNCNCPPLAAESPAATAATSS